ncbi:MAG: chromate transporter [Ignavibacteria bacterium RBG_16_34_14]|nr:MAG: chromate transporter [Ignavibacteria bacterium RBG_16_34_14]
MIETLIKLFLSFLKVGSFSFGGAYSLIPLIEREVVTNNQWLSQEEFLKVLGVVEVFPGAISIKYATYTGYKTAGVAGIIAANLGNMFVPLTIMLLIFYFYSAFEKNKLVVKAFDGIKLAVIGMILGIMFQYFMNWVTDFKGVLFVAVGLLLVLVLKLHPAYIVIIAGILGILIL